MSATMLKSTHVIASLARVHVDSILQSYYLNYAKIKLVYGMTT